MSCTACFYTSVHVQIHAVHVQIHVQIHAVFTVGFLTQKLLFCALYVFSEPRIELFVGV